jgi:hypothetical protein
MGEGLSIPLFDSTTGTLMLPLWAAVAIAAYMVVAVVLSMLRGGRVVVVGGLVGIAFLLLVATIAWVGTERLANRERGEERNMLVARAQSLAAQAAVPGSPLACLDAVAGETVETACERVLFGSPETIAAATAYTAARIALLSDGVDYALRTNASYEGALPGLRRALEMDRFGFVAQVLASQYGCTSEHCEAFTLFRDTIRLAANLNERTYVITVGRNAANWGTRTERAGPERAAPERPVASSRGSPVPPGFNLPSAASIPPVSIMVPEPSGSGPPQATNSPPAAEAAPAPSPPPQRKQAAPRPARPAQPNPGASNAPAPPVQLVPPTASAPPAPVGNTGSAPRAQ